MILSHMGRATTPEQAAQKGKWWVYGGFRKSQELYHLDDLLLDPEAIAQAQETRRILLVEGCFDVAKLRAAGIKNVGQVWGRSSPSNRRSSSVCSPSGRG